MKANMYAVHDKASQAFMAPFFTASHGLASRMISDAVQDERSVLNKHPADFDLYHLGNFDDNTGLVVAVVPPVRIATALEFTGPHSVVGPREGDTVSLEALQVAGSPLSPNGR